MTIDEAQKNLGKAVVYVDAKTKAEMTVGWIKTVNLVTAYVRFPNNPIVQGCKPETIRLATPEESESLVALLRS